MHWLSFRKNDHSWAATSAPEVSRNFIVTSISPGLNQRNMGLPALFALLHFRDPPKWSTQGLNPRP